MKEAFPFDFKSDEFGNSPRSLSPASSVNLSVSSVSLGDLSDMQDWTTADSVETDRTSNSIDGDAVMGFNETDGIFTEMETDGALEEPKEARQLPMTTSISQLSPHLQGTSDALSDFRTLVLENGLDIGNSVEAEGSISNTILTSNEHDAFASHAIRDMPSAETHQPEVPMQRTVSTPGALRPSKTVPGLMSTVGLCSSLD